MEKKDFTITDALAIQIEQFNRWSKVLKPEYSERLRTWLMAENRKIDLAKDGYQVTRGSDLEMFIHNNLILENKLYNE